MAENAFEEMESFLSGLGDEIPSLREVIASPDRQQRAPCTLV